jgi:KipI family sensor histidine kinase inhibitor
VRLLNYGRRGLLVELDSLDQALRLSSDLDRCRPAGVLELVPGARTVLVQFDPALTNVAALSTQLTERAEVIRLSGDSLATGGAAPGAADEGAVVIPVVYDGPDLNEVARLTGLSPEDVVRWHTSARYTVAFTGFAPGFGYLSGGDAALVVPRRSTPRTRVLTGAVGLAGEFTGVYPRPGPGGWQIIGRTEVATWDLERDPAALLRPGVTVVFEAVTS